MYNFATTDTKKIVTFSLYKSHEELIFKIKIPVGLAQDSN